MAIELTYLARLRTCYSLHSLTKPRKISAFLNYSIQYTRGNADDPMMTFNRAGDNVDPIARLIPMSWDQRHTINLSVSYTLKNANATLTGYYNSGQPYTWAPLEETRLERINLYPNNSWKPVNYSVDFYGYYDHRLSASLQLRFSLLVENLLDRMNELQVDYQTGHANETVIREVDLLSHRSLFNDYSDRVNNPASFSAPRYVKFGVGLIF